MNHKQVEEYILSFEGAKLDYPFGKGVAVYQVYVPSSNSHLDVAQGSQEVQTEPYNNTVKASLRQVDEAIRQKQRQVASLAGEQGVAMRGDWKMFALIQEGSDPLRLSLKCDPQLAVLLREKYETVMPGYHLNKKHWNTVILTGQLDWAEIQGLIILSYNLVKG